MIRPQQLNRRRLLRGAGVTLALPLLSSLRSACGNEPETNPPRRMLLISNNLGVLPKPFFPEDTGRDYQLSPYLAELSTFRNAFTVLSGLSHPDVDGGHSTENCFLTAARGPTKSGFRNTISLDQFAAEQLGPVTRFPTLNLGVNIDKANRSLSWTRDGVLLPAEDRASALFRKMFVQGDAAAVQRQLHHLGERGSILDTLLDDTRQFRRKISRDDQSRLDQYLTSVREMEERLHSARQWELRPKPKTDQPVPDDIRDNKLFFEKFDLMLSMARLALESDSTRIVTLMVDAFATPVFKLHSDQSTTDGYHNLSHHGQADNKVQQLEDADRQQMALLGKLLGQLAETKDGTDRLLDRTMVLFGSNMGDANTHDNTNLPILLAGGGFKHGQHLAFRHDRNKPLCNLFVTMLQQMGIETDAFSSSSGSMSELERV
ncbi:DUF1552 domain-containing protein [Fuerstiella marisgermanici]|uniref:DUF1552 domain-containing protein n=1 Tax=Fuerstiella marisgermanici TaxID=1891926 RepID=A0A1P8WFT9_9PLAN|nr:DUF1552 domain-containing protein [Fuerstiella marisgermanici]APZ92925.1 hypothetical protein Fuma_02537 [Fuerstiella marisgermanici]